MTAAKRFLSPSTIRDSQQFYNSLRDSYDINIEDSLEELNNYGEITFRKKKKLVVLKDNNKVADYKVRKVMNEKSRYHNSSLNCKDSRNSRNVKHLTPINSIP